MISGSDSQMIKALNRISKENLRDLPGWENAPIPICMGGDFRALTWCCKPGSSLTFGYKCLRDEKLNEIDLSLEKFIYIKEEFSMINQWDSPYPCFGSISYCCMRRGGCHQRDSALIERYPNLEFSAVLEEYYSRKKELAKLLLKAAQNQKKVCDFIDDEHTNDD